MYRIPDPTKGGVIRPRTQHFAMASTPRDPAVPQRAVPRVILLFVAADVALLLLYLGNYAAGEPVQQISVFLNLNDERNLPTWYSSMQWFCVAVVLGYFVERRINLRAPHSWLLAVLPLVFLAMSLDEIAQIHEWIGRRSDQLLPDGTRQETAFSKTGIWMFIVGIPFALIFSLLVYSLRPYFSDTPGALRKIFVGVVILMAGALGVELLSNFVADSGAARTLVIALEEFLEMLGATVVLWGSWELACSSRETGARPGASLFG